MSGVRAALDLLHDRTDSSDRMMRLVTSWGGLVLLAAGLSIDNLGARFSLGLSDLLPVAVAGTIAKFSMASTWIGVGLGSELRRHWEQRAEIASGIQLTSLAIGTAAGGL